MRKSRTIRVTGSRPRDMIAGSIGSDVEATAPEANITAPVAGVTDARAALSIFKARIGNEVTALLTNGGFNVATLD